MRNFFVAGAFLRVSSQAKTEQPKPRPIESLEIALPDEVEADIDYTHLTLEPPRLDPPAVKAERPVELALNIDVKTKS